METKKEDSLLALTKEIQSYVLKSKKFNVRKEFHLLNIMAQAVKQAEKIEALTTKLSSMV